jgi:hypothetical protein
MIKSYGLINAQSRTFGSNTWKKWVYMIVPGHVLQFNNNYRHSIEAGFAIHDYNCRGFKVHQFTACYTFFDDYMDVGLKYRHNIFKPHIGFLTPYTFFSLKGSYFDDKTNNGYKLKPELGFSIIITRKVNPFTTIDVSYGFNHFLNGDADFEDPARHTLNLYVSLGYTARLKGRR